MMYAFLGKQIKIVFQGMVVFLFLGSLQASQRYEFSDEERLLLHNTAQACDLEDMSYIRTHSLNKEDALSFVLAPKGDVSQIPESSLLSAKALLDNQAWGALQSLARSACWGDIHTRLIDDLRVSYGDYIHQYWSPTYYREAKSLYFTAMKHPAGYHEVNRTWDWLDRMVGIRVLPSAEERIARRLAEFEKAMAIVEGRRLSDASTESADSADIVETEPLLERGAEGHLKAE